MNDLIEANTIWTDEKKLTEVRKLVSQSPLTDVEFSYLVNIGKATNLNPFLREIWAVKYSSKSAAQIFIGRDGYRKAAQSHHDYDYHQVDAVYENDIFKVVNGNIHHEYTPVKRGELLGAYCKVKRKSASKEMYVYVDFHEYNLKQSVWKEKPATMIRKVAEAQALRTAFQDLLAGTYSDAERPSSQTETLKHTLRETKDGNNHDNQNGQVYDAEIQDSSNQAQTAQNNDDGGLDRAGSEKVEAFNSGRDDIQITDEQLDYIHSLMYEASFTDERKQKALDYFKVDDFKHMSDAQARLFILQLEKL